LPIRDSFFSAATAVLVGAAALGGSCPRSEAAEPAHRQGPPPFGGINLATGSFAAEKIPGRYGFDYVYPDRATAAPFLAAGMTAVRVPVIWERLQPQAGGPLDEAEMGHLDASLRDMDGFRHIILDVHNYGDFHRQHVTDTPELTAAFADLWSKLATRYRGQPNIAFGLMNEPHDIPAPAWRRAADAAVAAVRRTGARNLILVPGTEWTGARTWTEGGNAAAFAGFRDPGNNFAFEMHLYLDADGSGTSPDCVSETVGVERVRAATAWLRANRYRGFLGEFGSGQSPTCLAGLDRLVGFVAVNSDAWIGWTYWAGGAWWGDYFMSAQPGPNGKPKPQLQALARHLPPPSPAAAGKGKSPDRH